MNDWSHLGLAHLHFIKKSRLEILFTLDLNKKILLMYWDVEHVWMVLKNAT